MPKAARTSIISSKAPTTPRYWLIVASRDHALRAVEGGFIQANHGKKPPMQRLANGDGILIYSSKIKMGEATTCQKITAIGRVKKGDAYQGGMVEGGCEMWRRDVDWVKGVKEVDIKPLVKELGFIRNKERWGAELRFGFVRVGEEDFERVRKAMRKNKA